MRHNDRKLIVNENIYSSYLGNYFEVSNVVMSDVLVSNTPTVTVEGSNRFK